MTAIFAQTIKGRQLSSCAPAAFVLLCSAVLSRTEVIRVTASLICLEASAIILQSPAYLPRNACFLTNSTAHKSAYSVADLLRHVYESKPQSQKVLYSTLLCPKCQHLRGQCFWFLCSCVNKSVYVLHATLESSITALRVHPTDLMVMQSYYLRSPPGHLSTCIPSFPQLSITKFIRVCL